MYLYYKRITSDYQFECFIFVLRESIESSANVRISTQNEVVSKGDSTHKFDDFRIDNDPAKWLINETTRDYVVRHGFQQNADKDFSKSKREYNDGKNRYLLSSMFESVLINAEKIRRSWLVYSEIKKGVFCGICLLFANDSENKNKVVFGWFQ